MLSCKQLIPAQSILLDNFTNSISAINILQDIGTSYPTAIPVMVCSVFERLAADTANPDITLHLSLNGALITSPIPLSVAFGESLIARNVINLGVIPISSPGNLQFKVKKGDDPLFEYNVLLKSAVIENQVQQ